MIVRSDLLAWGLAAVLALASAAGRIARPASPRPYWAVLAGGALALALAGLAWRGAAVAHAWPGAVRVEGLALVACGGLACALWQDWRTRADPLRDRPAAAPWHAAGIGFAGILLLVAVGDGWRNPLGQAGWPARSWLYGLRSLLAGLGLGGWLFLAAGAIVAARSALAPGRFRLHGLARAWPRRPVREPVPLTPAEAARLAEPGPPAPGAAEIQVAEAPGQSVPGSNGNGSGQERVKTAWQPPLTGYGLRFAFPFLTAALLAGTAWNLAAFAVPWRGRPGELWLAVAWLLGAMYLHAGDGRHGVRPALLAVLSLLGLAAALAAAWQMPSLLS